jgi:hypothetical protein
MDILHDPTHFGNFTSPKPGLSPDDKLDSVVEHDPPHDHDEITCPACRRDFWRRVERILARTRMVRPELLAAEPNGDAKGGAA